MKKWMSRIIIFLMAFSLKAQENQPAYTYLYLKNGEVFSGEYLAKTDSSINIKEQNLGEIEIPLRDISKTQELYEGLCYKIKLINGTIYIGKLQSIKGEKIVFIEESGLTFSLCIDHILKVYDVSKKGVASQPNSTRYFFAPSALPVPKGEGYYQNAYLLSNSVSFGVTDRYTMGGGVVIPLAFYVTPKYSFVHSDKWSTSIGIIAGTSLIGDNVYGGVPYGLVTYGESNYNISYGIGAGGVFVDGEWQTTQQPFHTINGMIYLNRKFQLVSENWIVPIYGTQDEMITPGSHDDVTGEYIAPVFQEVTKTRLYMALSFGMRVRISENSTVDFCPVYLYGDGEGFAIPYLDFVYTF